MSVPLYISTFLLLAILKCPTFVYKKGKSLVQYFITQGIALSTGL
jgi:hypothetical protein